MNPFDGLSPLTKEDFDQLAEDLLSSELPVESDYKKRAYPLCINLAAKHGYRYSRLKNVDFPAYRTDHIGALVGLLHMRMSDLSDEYDSDDSISFKGAVAAEIYRQLIGFKNPRQLVRHFRQSNYQGGVPVHELLGLSSIPHYNTLQNAINERFNSHTCEFIKRWSNILGVVGLRRGYYFPDIEDRQLSNNGGITEISIEQKRGYAHGALDLLRDDMPITKNEELATWTDYGIHFDYSLHLCDTGNAPEAELENFADNRGLQKGVDIFQTAETFRNDIYRVGVGEWKETFDRWTQRLLDAVYPKTLRERQLPISVDATNIPTWANETSNLPGVVGTEKLDNTHYAYQILSGQAVSDGMPFQLAQDLQIESRPIHEQLNDLLDKIEARGCNIGLILGDSDFASGRCMNELKGRDVDFVIAYPKNYVTSYTDKWEGEEKTFAAEPYVVNRNKDQTKRSEVTLFGEYQSKLGHGPEDAQKTLSQFFDPETEYVTSKQSQKTAIEYMKHQDVDIFEANNRMRWFTFVTNLDVTEDEARALRQYYHYRWAIESAFGSYKTHFLPGTKSTNLGLRTYLYLFGMSAYNAWVAANIKARRQHLQDNERNRPPIRASRFSTLGQQRYRTDEFLVDYTEF